MNRLKTAFIVIFLFASLSFFLSARHFKSELAQMNFSLEKSKSDLRAEKEKAKTLEEIIESKTAETKRINQLMLEKTSEIRKMASQFANRQKEMDKLLNAEPCSNHTLPGPVTQLLQQHADQINRAGNPKEPLFTDIY